MAYYHSDPRLSLYDTTQNVFDQVVTDLGRHELVYLPIRDEHLDRAQFTDPDSTFEADEFALTSIEHHDVFCYTVGIRLMLSGVHYLREADKNGPKGKEIGDSLGDHLVIVVNDGPPAMTHFEYFGDYTNTPGDLPRLISAGYAEPLGYSRAKYLQTALSKLSAEQLDPELLA